MRPVQSFAATTKYSSLFLAYCFLPRIHSGFWHTLSSDSRSSWCHPARASHGTPSFDKDFRGPVTKQIRAARTFLRETSFFERFQHRKSEGGFAEERELPAIAIDEAIVIAVAHRDYYTNNPIECEHYSDEFIVKNPGRIFQRTSIYQITSLLARRRSIRCPWFGS